jgi:hypothetical protein
MTDNDDWLFVPLISLLTANLTAALDAGNRLIGRTRVSSRCGCSACISSSSCAPSS